MTTKQSITNLKFKLKEAILIIEDLTDSDTQQSYTLSDGTHISYLTALVRKHVKLGWQPRDDMNIEPHLITEAFILDGNMSITYGSHSIGSTTIQVRNVTFPPQSNQLIT